MYLTQKELDGLKKTVEEYKEKTKKLEDENTQLSRNHEKNYDMPLSSNKSRDNFAMEQMAMIILSKSKNGQQFDEETKMRLNSSFGANFGNVFASFSEKLKQLENNLKAYKEKYHEKIWKFISKMEEMKWLCNIILQNSEIISRSQNNQLSVTLIILKEDLEQKRSIIQEKIKDANEEIDKDKEELKVITTKIITKY